MLANWAIPAIIIIGTATVVILVIEIMKRTKSKEKKIE